MAHRMRVVFCCAAALSLCCCSRSRTDAPSLVIYVYDSFASEWGPGPELARRFYAKTGYSVQYVVFEDVTRAIHRAIRDQHTPSSRVADLIIGVDQYTLPLAREADLFSPYQPALPLPHALRIDPHNLAVPYDWGYVAFMFNTDAALPEPQRLSDLANPVYAKSIALADPHTNVLGTIFIGWAHTSLGAAWPAFWNTLYRANLLALAPSWSAAYGLFTAGEAALVLSYTTSAAYHLHHDNHTRFKPLLFPEGHPMHIEGISLVKRTKHARVATQFIDFLLSTEAQELLPLTQWMYPANPDVPLPAAFSAVPQPAACVSLSPQMCRAAAAALHASTP